MPEEVAREILTAEPIKPSECGMRNVGLETNENEKPDTRKDEQRSGLRSAVRRLKGDLDNIILKALRKEPERRYASVQEFSEDIRRHLEGLPVTATADTVSYRFNRFVKRHRAGVVAGGLIVLTLLVATAVTTWQAVVARRERDNAEHRFNQVRKLANTVLFEYQDGIRKLAGSTPIREKMLRDSLEYLDSLAAESINDMDLLRELAAAYERIGDVQNGDDSFGTVNQSKSALVSYQKALRIREEISSLFPQNSDDLLHLAVCYRQVADGLGVTGDFHGRLANYEKAIKIHETLVQTSPSNEEFQQGFAGGLYDLGHAYDQANENAKAIAGYDKAIEIWQRLSNGSESNAEVNRKLSKAYKFLGNVLLRENKIEEAIGNYQKALSLDETRVAFDNADSRAKLDLSASNMVFANLYLKTGDLRSAEEFCQKGLEIRKVLIKTDPQSTDIIALLARAYDTLGQIEQKKQNLEIAIENYRHAITIFTQPQRTDSSDRISNNYLANFYKHLAAAYEELSAKTVSGENRRQNLLKARENYQKTFDIVKTLQEQGTTTSQNSAGVYEIAQKINICDAALRKN